MLSDPRGAFPPYDAVLLLSLKPQPAQRSRERSPPCATPSVTLMRRANAMVDRDHDKRTPAEAAGWLSRQIGVRGWGGGRGWRRRGLSIGAPKGACPRANVIWQSVKGEARLVPLRRTPEVLHRRLRTPASSQARAAWR